MRGSIVLALAGGVMASGSAFGQVTNIDSMELQLRRFNDFPNSTLKASNDFPTSVVINESAFGDGGFANQHVGYFADGGAQYEFQNGDAFNISFDVMLDVGSVAPRKEVGFRFDTKIGGEAFFFVTSDGEVSAFGSFFPFFSFGGDAYTTGETANLGIVYTPGDGPGGGTPSTLEYFYNGVGSGALETGNLENGFIDGTIGGVYAQYQPDKANPDDFANTTFSNFNIAVPAPGAAAALGLLALAGARRRR